MSRNRLSVALGDAEVAASQIEAMAWSMDALMGDEAGGDRQERLVDSARVIMRAIEEKAALIRKLINEVA